MLCRRGGGGGGGGGGHIPPGKIIHDGLGGKEGLGQTNKQFDSVEERWRFHLSQVQGLQCCKLCLRKTGWNSGVSGPYYPVIQGPALPQILVKTLYRLQKKRQKTNRAQ